jgi:hypothetical protein
LTLKEARSICFVVGMSSPWTHFAADTDRESAKAIRVTSTL